MLSSKTVTLIGSKGKFWLPLLLLLALLLRLPLLNSSFWLDEAAQVLESSRPLRQQLQIMDDFQPPLLHLLTFFSIRVGEIFDLGRSEWWLRLWGALLPGLLSVYFTYKIGQRLFNKKVALWSSLLLATSSLHIFFSQELRPYSLAVCFAMASTWSLLKLGQSKGRFANLLSFVLFSLGGLYSTYLYPFFLLSQLLLAVYLFLKKHWSWHKSYWLAPLLIILGYLPWLPFFWQQLQAGQLLRQSLSGWEEVVSFSQLKAVLLVPAKFIYGVSDLELQPFYLASAALVVGFLLISLWRSRSLLSRWPKKTAFLFTALLLLLPLLLAWVTSFWLPLLQPKRVLFLLPLFYLLLSAWVEQSKKSWSPLVFLLPLLLSLNLWGCWQYWSKAQLQREDWRGLIQQLNQQLPIDRSIALFAFPEPYAPWRYYQEQSFATLSSGLHDLRQLADPQDHFKQISNYDYVVVFDYLRDLSDPDDQLLTIVRNLGFSEILVLDYPNIGFVRIYSAPGQTMAGAGFIVR